MFSRDYVRSRVVSILQDELYIESCDYDPTRSLIKLGADSLDVLQIGHKLEKEFGISNLDDFADRHGYLQDSYNTNDIIQYVMNVLNALNQLENNSCVDRLDPQPVVHDATEKPARRGPPTTCKKCEAPTRSVK